MTNYISGPALRRTLPVFILATAIAATAYGQACAPGGLSGPDLAIGKWWRAPGADYTTYAYLTTTRNFVAPGAMLANGSRIYLIDGAQVLDLAWSATGNSLNANPVSKPPGV